LSNAASKDLLQRYLANQCSPDERRQAEQLLATPEGEVLLRELLDASPWPDQLPPSSDAEEATQQRVWDRLRQEVNQGQPTGRVIAMPRYWLYGVAAALAGLAFFLLRPQSDWLSNKEETVARRDYIAPAGQRTQFTLPDGSRVWLNGQSQLRLSSTFGQSAQRQVELQGEAYFEVAHDTKHPFVVRSGAIHTQVLGTRFNVRAYADDPDVEVAVLSGKVRVGDRKQPSVDLLPNQKSQYVRETGRLTKQTITDATRYRAWTADQLVIDNRSVAEICRLLNRRFNVQIRVSDDRLNACVLTTRFDKPTLSGVLRVLCTYLNGTYQRQGNTILLSGKGC
jgi:ferric-dicitrate binding protein FerR (iron transport regulator)